MTKRTDKVLLSLKPIPPSNAVKNAIDQFEQISLKEMDSVKLMDRFDTKFVFSRSSLAEILHLASTSYRVLEIDGKRIFDYNSQYFDTEDFGMYHAHHNRKLNRFKVRRREYLNSGQVFFEIKFKSNKGRTRKKRIEVSSQKKKFHRPEKKFLKKTTPYRAKMLIPILQNFFHRISLVHKHCAERVTIDVGIAYRHVNKSIDLPFLSIVEIKQDGSSGISDLERILRDKHILPQKFSKYCMGMILLYPDIKYNRFKQKLITLNNLSNDSGYASFYN